MSNGGRDLPLCKYLDSIYAMGQFQFSLLPHKSNEGQ